MGEFTLGRSPINVFSVENPLAGNHNSLIMIEFTLAISPICVISVEKPLV
jgi:hypothetical protein